MRKKSLSIILLCEIAGIARAAYYKWLNRTPSARELQNEEIIKEMKALHEKVEWHLWLSSNDVSHESKV